MLSPLNTLNTDNSVTTAMALNNFNLGGTVRNPFCPRLLAALAPALYIRAWAPPCRAGHLLSPFPEFGTITTTNNDGKSWFPFRAAQCRKKDSPKDMRFSLLTPDRSGSNHLST
jgi:hypothetical protein